MTRDEAHATILKVCEAIWNPLRAGCKVYIVYDNDHPELPKGMAARTVVFDHDTHIVLHYPET